MALNKRYAYAAQQQNTYKKLQLLKASSCRSTGQSTTLPGQRPTCAADSLLSSNSGSAHCVATTAPSSPPICRGKSGQQETGQHRWLPRVSTAKREGQFVRSNVFVGRTQTTHNGTHQVHVDSKLSACHRCLYERLAYLVEVEQHVVAELAGAEELSLFGDLKAVCHRNRVEHLEGSRVARVGSA